MSRLAVALTAVFAVSILAACGGGGGGGGDATAPTVSITSHADGATVTTMAISTISGTLADDGAISAVTVTHGGVDVTATVSPTFDQTSFSFPLTLTPGDNTLEVHATDAADNNGASGVVNLFSLVVTGISANNVHTCATTSTGNARCWGDGIGGMLGHDSTANIGDGAGATIAVAGDVPVGGAVTQIAAGSVHTCALLSTGAVRCWGAGNDGQLGQNDAILNIGDGVAPGQSIIDQGDVPVGGVATGISALGDHTCAVLDSGAVRCWGIGDAGQLGHNAILNIGDGVAGQSIIDQGDVPVF